MADHKPMQAVLISPPQPAAFGVLTKRFPIELLPLLGKPFIGRIVEHLTTLGFADITVYAGTFAAEFDAFVGNGRRWGVSIEVVDVSSVGDGLQRLSSHHTLCLLGSTLQLPALPPSLVDTGLAGCNVRFIADGVPLHWGIIREWSDHPPLSLDELFGARQFEQVDLDRPCLGVDSTASLLQASRDMLSGGRPDLLIEGSHAEPEVFIGHNVVIHPTVTIHPPVFLASEITIGKGVSLGPMAVIETDGIVDDFSTVESSIIMPGTYVGRQLEIKQSLVDRNYLACTETGDMVPVGDSFLIGPSESGNPTTCLSLLVRLLTLTLAVLVIPLFLAFFLLGIILAEKPVIRAARTVRLPASEDPLLWQTFRHRSFTTTGSDIWSWMMGFWPLRGIPTLFNIVCGHIQWVGVKPRTVEELESLPDDWQQLILTGRNGLICLADLDTDTTQDGSLDQRYSSEAFYVATRNLKNDLGVLCRALGRWRHQPD